MGLKRNQVPIDRLKDAICLYEESGVLTWKDRPRCEFNSDRAMNAFNSRFSGKPAFDTPHDQGYLTGRIFGVNLKAHRVVWAIYYGFWPDVDIDHINMVKSDNRVSNLRLATRSQNSMNKPIHSNNMSGFKGVYYDRKDKIWKAAIMRDGAYIWRGSFPSPEVADMERRNILTKFHGEFSRSDKRET